jgi:2'-5' RNA ligase
MPADQSRRLFFALWPDAALAEALGALAVQAKESCGGRATATADIHLTLAFLGDIGAEAVREAEAVAARLDCGAVDMAIDRLGYWKHNRILWAGCSELPKTLAHLAGSLGDQLRQTGFTLDARPFAAHVTLLRDARCRELPAFGAPLHWRSSELILAGSVPRTQPRYSILRRWPLRVAD